MISKKIRKTIQHACNAEGPSGKTAAPTETGWRMGGRSWMRWTRRAVSGGIIVFALIASTALGYADLPKIPLSQAPARSPLQLEVESAYNLAARQMHAMLDVERGYPARPARYAEPTAPRIEVEPTYPVTPTALDVEGQYPWTTAVLEPEVKYPATAALPLAVESEHPTACIPHLQLEDRYPTTQTALLDVEGDYPSLLGTVLQPEGDYPNPAPADGPGALRDTGRPAIALTFDTEIPHGEEARRTLNDVLDTLQDAGVRATFFVVGYWARANPHVLQRLVAEGHEVANHSFTHRSFSHRPPEELGAELHRVADLVLRETGAPIAPLFRPPYGCIDELTARVARDNGYQLTGWTASGSDARGATRTGEEVVAAVRRNLRHGEVVLLHTNRWITAAALPEILRIIEARGLEAVSVSELLRRSPSTAVRIARGALRNCTLHTAKLSRNPRTAAY